MPRHVGLTLLVSATLLVPGSAVASGGHGREFRVTPDNRPGSYQRLDGTRDALHDACAQPSPPAGRPVDRGQSAQPARDRRGRHGRLHRVPQPGPRAAAAARARALPQHRRRPNVGREPVPRLRRLGHRAGVRARLHDACPAVAGVRPSRAPVRTPRAARCSPASGRWTSRSRSRPSTATGAASCRRSGPTRLRLRSRSGCGRPPGHPHGRHHAQPARRQRLRRLRRVRRLRPAGTVRERERVRDPCRALDRPRPDVLPAGRDRGPRGPFHERAGSRRGTRRRGARDVPQLPDRQAAADLDRALDRRRRVVLAGATGRPVHDVRIRASSRSRPARRCSAATGRSRARAASRSRCSRASPRSRRTTAACT